MNAGFQDCKEGIDFWNGDSIGRREGKTLVADVANFNDQWRFDRAGNFHSDALHAIERYTAQDGDRRARSRARG